MTAVDKIDDLDQFAAATVGLRGAALFDALAQTTARTLGAAETVIGELVEPQSLRTLAACTNGVAEPNYRHDLAGGPCAAVLRGATVHHPSGLAELFPHAARGHQGFFGTPLLAANGGVIGQLCAFAPTAMPLTPAQRAMALLLADRAAAEVERLSGDRRIEEHERQIAQLRRYNEHLQRGLLRTHDREAVVGTNPAFLRALEDMRRIAPTDSAVLISGEPGTGKELIARALHAHSRRAGEPFIRLDAAGPPADEHRWLAASAFASPADDARLTLFVDEVAALRLEDQERLLGLLQGQDVERGERTVPVNVRVVVATSRDLRKAVQAGEFREDLYYRLGLFSIDLPPLRARPEDIAALALCFARRYAPRADSHVTSIDPDTLANLARYAWPGNVRELERVVERTLMLGSGAALKVPPEMLAVSQSIEREQIAAAATGMYRALAAARPSSPLDIDDVESTGLHHVQREHILRVLNATRWVIEGNSGAALKLGMKPATLRHRMKKLGIARAGQQSPA